MASKSKGKLKKNQFEVEGRIIDLQRFAYDIFVHSAKKFGVPEDCICDWEGEKNDYLYQDFILVLSRTLFKNQIIHRFDWCAFFVESCKSTNFETFQKIQNLLQDVLADAVRKINKNSSILQEVVVSLSVINELILFLYSRNCKLYLKELAKFWFQYWCHKKKDLEKAGGLAKIYELDSEKRQENWDIFFDKFIPEFCIPYEWTCVCTLKSTYFKECDKFVSKVEANISEKIRRIVGTTHQENLVTVSDSNTQVNLPPDSRTQVNLHLDSRTQFNLPLDSRTQVNLPNKTSERDEASGIDTSRNLAILMHPNLLRDVYRTDAVPSSQDLPGTSGQGTERDGSAGQKGQQKKSILLSRIEKHLQQLNLDSLPRKSSEEKN